MANSIEGRELGEQGKETPRTVKPLEIISGGPGLMSDKEMYEVYIPKLKPDVESGKQVLDGFEKERFLDEKDARSAIKFWEGELKKEGIDIPNQIEVKE